MRLALRVLPTLLILLMGVCFGALKEDPAKKGWTAFCEDTEKKSRELKGRYDELTPDEQAEVQKGMAPPERWVHFDCEKNWADFGEQCAKQSALPVENCIYAAVLNRVQENRL